MKHLLLLTGLVALTACGPRTTYSSSNYPTASGPMATACLNSDRRARSAALCGCVQQAANLELTALDQRRAARFWSDPQAAQDLRTSDRLRDEAAWQRYRAFLTRAEGLCRGA